MISPGVLVRYLFGDSTESGLEFNYLAFIREIMDAAIVLVECDGLLSTTEDRKRAKEREAAAVIAGIEELGKRTAHLVGPLVKGDESPLSRCATAIAIAAKDAIERESTQVRATAASAVAAIESENTKLRKRSADTFERLLRTHDLPNAERVYEVAWTSSGLKAAMRQRTAFGIEAVLALDVPSGSLFTSDLRIDKIVEGVEINALEPGGWLNKKDKLVPIKLGRYHITRVVVGQDVTVRVRSTADATAAAFEITTDRDGEIRIERLGGQSTAREFSIEDQNQPRLRQLTDKLAEAARALGEKRTTVVSVEIDGKPLADHPQPRAIAERLVLAIAPTVVKIARHSRSPGELVLRRMLGDDRREEIFVTTAELLKKLDPLPPHAREVFAPLQLDGDATPHYVPPAPSRESRKTMPPMHPPPPPPLARRPPSHSPSGTQPLPALIVPSRTVSETIQADDLIELAASSPAIPIVTLETQPTSSATLAPAEPSVYVAPDLGGATPHADEPSMHVESATAIAAATEATSAEPGHDDDTVDHTEPRAKRETRLTDPPGDAREAEPADSDDGDGEPVPLDIMKATADLIEEEQPVRAKSDSLGSQIDAAIDDDAK